MKPIRRMGSLREGLSIASLYCGSTATLMLPLVLAGCSADGVTNAEGVATDDEAFTMWSNARDGLIRKANAGNTVKICLTGTGVTDATRATYRTHIKDAIMAWITGAQGAAVGSLIGRSDITFTCSSDVDVAVNWSADVDRATASVSSVKLYSNDGYRTVLHEFGHVFGFADTYIEGPLPGCQDGQENSVMCSGPFETLQPDDINAIQELYCMQNASSCKRRKAYGAWCQRWAFGNTRLYVGDVNNDGRSDLICNNSTSSMLSVDYADLDGTFTSTDDWSKAIGFCNGAATRNIYLGDYNHDHRTDLLCHDSSSGSVWIAYSKTSGDLFTGTDWSDELGWCNGSSTRRVLTGDFNQDHRTDLLCHDTSSGAKWVAYAKTGDGDRFTGTDWSGSISFCNNTASRNLYTGDFNGDQRTDMICHDNSTGEVWISYAKSSGALFTGSDWWAPLDFCSSTDGAFLVGDFNADGRDDLLCHHLISGSKRITFADSAGKFKGTSRKWGMDWCTASTETMMLGDFDNNGASDFLCYDPPTGKRFTAFQYP